MAVLLVHENEEHAQPVWSGSSEQTESTPRLASLHAVPFAGCVASGFAQVQASPVSSETRAGGAHQIGLAAAELEEEEHAPMSASIDTKMNNIDRPMTEADQWLTIASIAFFALPYDPKEDRITSVPSTGLRARHALI